LKKGYKSLSKSARGEDSLVKSLMDDPIAFLDEIRANGLSGKAINVFLRKAFHKLVGLVLAILDTTL